MIIDFQISVKFSYRHSQFNQECNALKIIKIRPELTSPAQVKKSLLAENQPLARISRIIIDRSYLK